MDVPAKVPKLKLSHRDHHILQSSNDFLPLLGSTIHPATKMLHIVSRRKGPHHAWTGGAFSHISVRAEFLRAESVPSSKCTRWRRTSSAHDVRDIRGAQLATPTIVGKRLHHLGVEDTGPMRCQSEHRWTRFRLAKHDGNYRPRLANRTAAGSICGRTSLSQIAVPC